MLEELLKRIAAALDQSALPYVIIGGQAVLLYGEPRLTKDIDITLGVGLERLPDVLAAAQAAQLTPLSTRPALQRYSTYAAPSAIRSGRAGQMRRSRSSFTTSSTLFL